MSGWPGGFFGIAAEDLQECAPPDRRRGVDPQELDRAGQRKVVARAARFEEAGLQVDHTVRAWKKHRVIVELLAGDGDRIFAGVRHFKAVAAAAGSAKLAGAGEESVTFRLQIHYRFVFYLRTFCLEIGGLRAGALVFGQVLLDNRLDGGKRMAHHVALPVVAGPLKPFRPVLAVKKPVSEKRVEQDAVSQLVGEETIVDQLWCDRRRFIGIT